MRACGLILFVVQQSLTILPSLPLLNQRQPDLTMNENDGSIDDRIMEDETDNYLSITEDLPRPLKFLYALNGATEALPTLALTSIVNDRIEIPISFLPAYYAVAFLPYSLKPIYAIATSVISIRPNVLLVILLLSSAAMIQVTAFLHQGQVLGCFIVAFAKGICVSWAEFLVGLSLILAARTMVESDDRGPPMDKKLRQQQRHEVLLSCYQSQAATSRNMGSLLAHFVSFGILLRQYESDKNENDDGNGNGNGESQMSDGLVTGMIMLASFCPLAASFVVVHYRVGSRDGAAVDCDNNGSRQSSSSSGSFKGFMKYDIISALLFQALLVIIGLRTVIIAGTSKALWDTLSALLVISMAISISCSRNESTRYHESTRYSATNVSAGSGKQPDSTFMQHLVYIKRVAVYLVLRHSIPSAGVMLSSYTYTIFRSKPLFLQTISLLGSITAVISTWTYGKQIAKTFSSLSGIKVVIVVATVLSSLWSLFSIPFIRAFRERNDDVFAGGITLICLYTVFQSAGGFLSELSFLPSVVLATTSIVHQASTDDNSEYNHGGPSNEFNESCCDTFEDPGCQVSEDTDGEDHEQTSPMRLDDGVVYGILIACIDFGDQLSDFVSVPIVGALNIRRDNRWGNLEWFVVACSFLSIFSLFLRLL